MFRTNPMELVKGSGEKRTFNHLIQEVNWALPTACHVTAEAFPIPAQRKKNYPRRMRTRSWCPARVKVIYDPQQVFPLSFSQIWLADSMQRLNDLLGWRFFFPTAWQSMAKARRYLRNSMVHQASSSLIGRGYYQKQELPRQPINPSLSALTIKNAALNVNWSKTSNRKHKDTKSWTTAAVCYFKDNNMHYISA